MAGFLGNLLSAARQVILGDDMQSAGQFKMVEIPANELRSNVYVRALEDQLAPGLSDVVYAMRNVKNEQYHVVIRFQSGVVTKIFSIYRDLQATRGSDVGNRFRGLVDLLLLAENEQKLKEMVDCIHSHATWDGVHVAAAVGAVKFFSSLRGDRIAVALITSRCPESGLLPIHIAVDNNRPDVVEELLALGADVNDADLNGMNAFHYAASVNGNMIKILCKHPHASTVVNALNNAGRTPIFIAVIVGKPDCVSALVKAGAVGTTRCEGKTVLEAALKSISVRKAEIVETLAKAFPSLIIEPDENGSTPLHYCTDSKLLKTLIRGVSNNSFFNIRDNDGETPLHLAIRRADVSAVVNFIAHGADIDAKIPDGQTPLHLSLALVQQAGQLLIIKALLIFGASCTATDGNGFLPRHIAACSVNSLTIWRQITTMFEMVDAERCFPDQKGCTDSCRYMNPQETPSVSTTASSTIMSCWLKEKCAVETISKFKTLEYPSPLDSAHSIPWDPPHF